MQDVPEDEELSNDKLGVNSEGSPLDECHVNTMRQPNHLFFIGEDCDPFPGDFFPITAPFPSQDTGHSFLSPEDTSCRFCSM